MKTDNLQKRLVAYLQKNPNHQFAKDFLVDKARSAMAVSADSVSRRLRVLAEVSEWGYRPTDTPEHRTGHQLLDGGKLEKEMIGGYIHYRYVPSKTKKVRRVEVIDGVAHEIFEEVNN